LRICCSMGPMRIATACDSRPRHIERRDPNGESGRRQVAAPRSPSARLQRCMPPSSVQAVVSSTIQSGG
jgi:hypothetical protein